MIIKQVKEYGSKTKRQRIDINKNDGLAPGVEVVLIPVDKYNELKQDILDLQNELMTARNEAEMVTEINSNYEQQIQDLKNQRINLKEIIEDMTTPIYENHQKELSKKDDEINQLQMQLKTLQAKTHQYNLELMGLNAIDIAIFRKHKRIIKKYNDEITLVGVDPKIIDADAQSLPGNDVPGENENAADGQ